MKKIFYLITTGLLIFTSNQAFAAPLLDPNSTPNSPDAIFSLVNNIKNILTGLVGIIILGMLIYGAVLYISSAGNDEKIQKAKQTMTAAIIGLIIIVCSYAIISFVANILGGGVS
jgi:hypothetical protein